LAVASSTPIPDSPPEPYNAPSYAFKYTVEDGPYGPVFSHGENREGYNTKGEYQVNLPDGRVKTVTYTVEGPSGFLADVKYDGVSVYPDAPPPPAPVYAPAPAAPKAAEPAADDAEEPTNAVDLREGKSAPAPAEPAPAPVYKPAPGKFIYYVAGTIILFKKKKICITSIQHTKLSN
jgi:Predicted membrane protein